jgi:alkylation response protein AidB-like acyl-CoA dehydrogenase
MQIISSKTLEHFRAECREWLALNVPRGRRPAEGPPMREFDLAWQRRQFDGGWAGISWPKEYGGRGASVLEQLIWFEECARAGAPASGTMFVALSHAGPTLITSASDEQKAFHLPRILRGEASWCQGFSEPGAGSDLASLRCKADIDGDHLVVNGSKIWTTYGDLSDYQELLIRTDQAAQRHKGISWVICDMKLPGIDIRPIKAMSGLTHFAHVFYDNVRIPMSNLIGSLNDGWRVAMTTLGFERGTGMIAHQLELSATVEHLIEVCRTIDVPGESRKAIEDDAIAAQLAHLRAEVAALRSLTVATVSRSMHDSVPGPEANIVALYFGELVRKVHQTALDLLGTAGLEQTEAENWPLRYLECFKWGIGGGTLEIRRNAIGERMLGLPKAPTARTAK